MVAREPMRRDEHEASDTRDAPRVEAVPRPVLGHPVRAPLARVTPQMLSALGNQGFQRALAQPPHWSGRPPIQRKAEKASALLDMSVGEFAQHRKTEQMDWASADFDETMRKAVWEIVDWGLEGLSEINLREAANEVAKGKGTVAALKLYCEALNGKIRGVDTIRLEKVDTAAAAALEGRWILKLTMAFGGGPLIRAVMPRDVFKDLIMDETVATALIDYLMHYRPTFQAPTGKDTRAFMDLVGTDKAKIADFAGELTSIRNYHKFRKASLQKLKDDKKGSDKELTLIFQALLDDSGAFTQHEHVNKVILNTKIRAFLLEGQSAADLKGLSEGGLQTIAATYGVKGKIAQVMFAGHGNATAMRLGGEGTALGQKESGEYTVIEKGHKRISFADDNEFWTAFFEALLKNMKTTKEGLKPTILLRACLTASNTVDTTKLKEELKSTGKIDVEDKTIDPTTEANQAKIRAGIVDYIKAHGSLAKVLGDKAGSRAEVLGAQASITSETTAAIDESSGQLEMRPLTDPMVAASKLEYVRHGKEPLGAIRAVIESWAENKDACFEKMRERISELVASDADFIINLLYRKIVAAYKNDIIAANDLTVTATTLTGISHAGPKCRVANLRADTKLQLHRGEFYPLLISRFNIVGQRLVIYQDWLSLADDKRASVATLLGHPLFDRDLDTDCLDFKALDPHVDPILKLSGGNLRGKIMLALIGFIDHKRPDCKAFLLTQVDDNQALSADVKDALGGASERKLREDLGLPVEAVVTTGGGTTGTAQRPKNISGYKAHVEAMPSRNMEMKNSSITDWAKLMSGPSDNSTMIERQYQTRTYTVVGTVKTLQGADAGWYMIRQADGTIGYMRTKYF